MQQRPPRISADPKILIIQKTPSPPTGKTPVPPVRKTPSPPPAYKTPVMNPIVATLIRVGLGIIGIAFYTVLFFAVIGFVAFYYGAQIFSENLVYKGAASKFYSRRLDTWQNRAMWMYFDGLWATIKYIFKGGNTGLFLRFLMSLSKPVARISKQYWDQEFHRL